MGNDSEANDGRDETLNATPRSPATMDTLAPAAQLSDLSVLPRVDRAFYAIGAEIARGGMGRILAARDLRMGRPVAVKELLHHDYWLRVRFEREARITARLQHPAIVPIYEAGTWDSGEPFYAMKRIEGRSLDIIISQQFGLDARLALLPNILAVAEALAFAHSKRVIHRDLKPGNVLVGEFGETVVIDWGLAKELDGVGGEARDAGSPPEPEGGDSRLTVDGHVIGTPVYMPPEQARGEVVDERADVYALGAILYHLLAGRMPYADSRGANEVLSKRLAGPPTPLGELQSGVPPDLLALVDKAMKPACADRYASAKELVEDLRRFLTGQLVRAHQYSTSQLVRRWFRKHRTTVIVAAVLGVLLGGTGVYSVLQILDERTESDHQRRLVEARNNRLILAQADGFLARDPTSSVAWLKQLPPLAPEWRAARIIASDARERGMARWVLRGHTNAVVAVAFSPDDRTLATAGKDRRIRLWNLASGEPSELTGHGAEIVELSFTPDGKSLVSMGGWSDPKGYQVVVWDLERRTPRPLPGPIDQEHYTRALLSPDGGVIAVMTCNGGIRLFDRVTLAVREVRSGAASPNGSASRCMHALAFSPDGRALAAESRKPGASASSSIELLDLETLRVTRTLVPERDEYSRPHIAFSPDGQTLVGSKGTSMWSWGVNIGERREYTGHKTDLAGDGIVDVAFSQDGTSFVSAGKDRTIRVWTLGQAESVDLVGHYAPVAVVAVSPDGHRVVSGAADEIRIWDVATRTSRVLRGHAGEINTLAVSHDGTWLASASDDKTVRVWSMDDSAHRSWNADGFGVTHLMFSSSGAQLYLSALDGRVESWNMRERTRTLLRDDARRPTTQANPLVVSGDGRLISAGLGQMTVFEQNGEPVDLGGDPGVVDELVASADTTLAVSMGRDRAIRLWNTRTKEQHVLRVASSVSRDPVIDRVTGGLAITSDARLVLWGERDANRLNIYTTATQQTRLIEGTAGTGIRAIAVTRANDRAISLGRDGVITIWDLTAGTSHVLARHDPDDLLLDISPDGAVVLSAGISTAVHLSDARGTRVLEGHTARIAQVRLSPDGRSIASASDDRTARIWDVMTGLARTVTHYNRVTALAWSKDGTHLATSVRNQLHVIADDLPTDEVALRAYIDGATNMAVDATAK